MRGLQTEWEVLVRQLHHRSRSERTTETFHGLLQYVYVWSGRD